MSRAARTTPARRRRSPAKATEDRTAAARSKGLLPTPTDGSAYTVEQRLAAIETALLHSGIRLPYGYVPIEVEPEPPVTE